MSAPRITGQDIRFTVMVDQQQVLDVLAIATAEWTYGLVIKEQAYLGEKFTRVDEMFTNIKGSIENHTSKPEMFQLIDIIVQRAQRRSPPIPRITMKASCTFPESGRRALVVFPDMKFGEIPVRVPNQGDYAAFTFPFACERAGAILIG